MYTEGEGMKRQSSVNYLKPWNFKNQQLNLKVFRFLMTYEGLNSSFKNMSDCLRKYYTEKENNVFVTFNKILRTKI